MTKDEALRLALDAFENIFASTHPYREDGNCTINDESVELSNKAIAAIENALLQPQREWIGLMRGIRVEDDTVIIKVKGGNDEARCLCNELIHEMEMRKERNQ
jgi:hypothetical protein